MDPKDLPAFPIPGKTYHLGGDAFTDPAYTGLTLRDYFAGQALMGMMASRHGSSPRFLPEDDAEYVYRVADAMLAAREAA